MGMESEKKVRMVLRVRQRDTMRGLGRREGKGNKGWPLGLVANGVYASNQNEKESSAEQSHDSECIFQNLSCSCYADPDTDTFLALAGSLDR